MSKAKPLPPLSLILEKLSYDPTSGCFTWKAGRRRGFVAGYHQGDYIKIQIAGEAHSAHRLAFYIHHKKQPVAEIDHIDGNGTNNAITNLREASRKQNARNRRHARGVDFNPKCALNPYQARIKYGDRISYLGTFPTYDAARTAYEAAANEHFGAFSPFNDTERPGLVGEGD